MFSVGREGKPVGLDQVFSQEANATLVVEAVHTLKRNFLLLSLDQIKRRVREVNGAVGTSHNIIGAVEFLAFIAVGEDSVFSLRRDRDDGSQNAGAINQAVLPVVGVAVRISESDHFLFAAIERDAIDLVLLFIAHV